MIDHQDEQLIRLTKVPDHLPGTDQGNRVHPATIYRWVSRGIRGVRLETVRIGGGRYTSIEALHRFIEATSDEASADAPGTAALGSAGPTHRSSRKRRTAQRVQRAVDEIRRRPAASRSGGRL